MSINALKDLGVEKAGTITDQSQWSFIAMAGQPALTVEHYNPYNEYIPVQIYSHVVTSVKTDLLAKYRYSGAGQRITKETAGGVSEYYLMDGDVNLAVLDVNGNVKYWNVFGSDLLGRYEVGEGKYVYYIKDILGSTRTVVDEGNTIVEANDFYPFGLKMPGRANIFGTDRAKESFTGKELDVESDWMYFGARDYDPAIARWLSVDPIAEKYPSVSSYNYSLNDPINKYDPDGMRVRTTEEMREMVKDLYKRSPTFRQIYDDARSRLDVLFEISRWSLDKQKEHANLKGGTGYDKDASTKFTKAYAVKLNGSSGKETLAHEFKHVAEILYKYSTIKIGDDGLITCTESEADELLNKMLNEIKDKSNDLTDEEVNELDIFKEYLSPKKRKKEEEKRSGDGSFNSVQEEGTGATVRIYE